MGRLLVAGFVVSSVYLGHRLHRHFRSDNGVIDSLNVAHRGPVPAMTPFPPHIELLRVRPMRREPSLCGAIVLQLQADWNRLLVLGAELLK